MKEHVTTVNQYNALIETIEQEEQNQANRSFPRICPDDYQKFYFRCGRKGEDLYFQQETFHLTVGEIISDIISIGYDFEPTAKALLEYIDSILESKRSFFDLCSLKELIARIDISPCLKSILFWQPLIISRYETDRIFSLSRHSITERNCFDNQIPAPYHEKQTANLSVLSNAKWGFFSKILSGNTMTISDAEAEILRQCLYDYRNHFQCTAQELIRLKHHLKLYLNPKFPFVYTEHDSPLKYQETQPVHTMKTIWDDVSVSPEYIELLRKPLLENGVSISIATQSDAAKIFPPTKSQKYAQVYATTSVSSLVALELDLLNKLNLEMKPCALCGKYYVPYSMRSSFCYRSNPRYNGKKCSVVGSLLVHRSKIKDSPLETLYKRRQKTYAKWVANNKNIPEQKIKDEIDDNFKKWKTTARNQLIAWRNDAITDDEFVASIALPPVHVRSESLYKLRQDIRALNGNLLDEDI